MSSVNCSYPGCTNTVSGKGLFCPNHPQFPGNLDKFSMVTDKVLEYRGETGSQMWTPPPVAMGGPSAGRPVRLVIAVVMALAILGIAGWVIAKFL